MKIVLAALSLALAPVLVFAGGPSGAAAAAGDAELIAAGVLALAAIALARKPSH